MQTTEAPVHSYTCLEGQFDLMPDGRLFRTTDVRQEVPWFKDSKTGNPWIPRKRRTFVSLIKQSIRERDFQP